MNSSGSFDHIKGFSDTGGNQGQFNDLIDFSAIAGITKVQGALNNTNQKVNADSIAWVYNSTLNETLVYVNTGSGAVSQTSNGLMVVALDGNNFHLTANNFKV